MPRAPLTPERRDLATRFIPFAAARAARYRARLPRLRCDFESAALLALAEAARSFDSARGVVFPTFAAYRIEGALQEILRAEVPRGWTGNPDTAPKRVPLDLGFEPVAIVMLATPDAPPGADDELAELLDAWLAKLPARHAAAVRLTHLEGRTQAEAARAIGVSKSRVSYLVQEALEILRDVWKVSRLDARDLLPA